MKPPPAGLPSGHSRKWHSRRFWDHLGYIRVRSLGNPSWSRDLGWLVKILRSERDHPFFLTASVEDRPLLDAAIEAVKRYPRTASGVTDSDKSWDEVLTCIDEVLIRRQERHLAAVRSAGRSG